jgi:hypothetical protein
LCSVTGHSSRQFDHAHSVPSLTGRASRQAVKAHHNILQFCSLFALASFPQVTLQYAYGMTARMLRNCAGLEHATSSSGG